jgi:beta-ribofuranosylaminobenzene 5'-phosphate synthase
MVSEVIVETPSRLHFTLIDLHGGLGRIDGGIGVALEHPGFKLHVSLTEKRSELPERVRPVFKLISEKLQLQHKYKIRIIEEIPAHVGLGSTTQLSLGILKAILLLEGEKSMPLEVMTNIVARSGTSGIGAWAFERGGFILDCGHSTREKKEFAPSRYSRASLPNLLWRMSLPDDWYFVVIIPHGNVRRIYGSNEKQIFTKYCPISKRAVGEVARIILMCILPALQDGDIAMFGTGLTRLQQVGFKRIENKLQSEFVRKLQNFLIGEGAAGAGISSFGPATYGVVKGIMNAKKLTRKLRYHLHEHKVDGTVFYTTANNHGAKIMIP